MKKNKSTLTILFAFFGFFCSENIVLGQTLQQVTDNGSTTVNVITVAGLTANAASASGAALPTNINTLNGIRINGTMANYSHNGITYQSGGGGGAAIGFSRGGSYDTHIDFYTNASGAFGNLVHRMRINSNGYMGIGTSGPQSILHTVGGNTSINSNNRFNTEGLIIEAKTGGRSLTAGAQLEFVIPANIDGSNEWGQGRIMTVAGNVNGSDATGKMVIGTRRMFSKNGLAANWYYGDDIVIDGAGNVGIGTLTPAEKLSVKGKIRAQEVKVEMNGWSDFVFAKDYKLPTLQETEKHIKEKGHLPGIPSAAEVEKNGIELGDMNKKLLQKIEELTLYLIEKDRQVQRIQQDNEDYRKRLEVMEKKIRNN